MAIEFKEKVTIQPVDGPEVAASRLEALLNRHLPWAEPVSDFFGLESTDWRLRDPSESRSSGATVHEVFEEFREHELTPYALYHDRRILPAKEGERGVGIHVHYPIRFNEIEVEIEGTNRMAVDGVAATVNRIKRAIEKPQDAGQASDLAVNRVEAQQDNIGPQVTSVRGLVTVTNRYDGAVGDSFNINNSSWLKRTWKDHTAQFLVTLVAGVLVIAIGLWLGLSPRP
ncbi:hypothetical protein [Pseudarthrobacter sp. WHRI 8279]|uniref:hypothetical protein n=1 Tax=Pseudarthrobacter sp. WHRI 8279 TaxID=3162566 RepID=UPI0032EFF528